MINIKELSMGNWIKISGTPVQILGIRTESQVYVLETEEADYAYAIDADIEPIEITPEILEKNGWRVVTGNQILSPWIAVWEKDDCSCVLFHNSKKAFITINNNTTNDNIIDVTYIHQLQNALTLCGINKEI